MTQGIDMRDAAKQLGKDAQGASVAGVQRGGPAARVCLRSGDVLIAANGAPISDAAELLAAVAVKPGQTMCRSVRRNGATSEIEVAAGEPRLRRRAPS